MTSKKILILYTNPDDSLMRCLKDHDHVEALHVDDLIPFISNADWPNIISAAFPQCIKDKFDGAIIINRLFTLHQTKLMAKFRVWRYHELWVHFALKSLFDLGLEVIHDRGSRGVSRSLLPLNTQWHFIQHSSDVKTPKYVYAFGGEVPDLSCFDDPLQKSVWSLFDWRVDNNLPDNERKWHRFYVERPTGTPVICCFVDIEKLDRDGLELFYPKNEVFVDIDRVSRIARQCSSLFRSRVGEFLLFVDNKSNMTFYAFSPLMESAMMLPSARDMLLKWADSCSVDSATVEPSHTPKTELIDILDSPPNVLQRA